MFFLFSGNYFELDIKITVYFYFAIEKKFPSWYAMHMSEYSSIFKKDSVWKMDSLLFLFFYYVDDT